LLTPCKAGFLHVNPACWDPENARQTEIPIPDLENPFPAKLHPKLQPHVFISVRVTGTTLHGDNNPAHYLG
jgi:hypothetical protein